MISSNIDRKYKFLQSHSTSTSYSSAFSSNHSNPSNPSTPSTLNSSYYSPAIPSPSMKLAPNPFISNNRPVRIDDLARLETISNASLSPKPREGISRKFSQSSAQAYFSHQPASTNYKQQMNPEFQALRPQLTSGSMRSYSSASIASSLRRNPSNVSQINFIRRSQLNKELPPLPPPVSPKSNLSNSKSMSSLKVPPPRPLRPSNSYNQLPPSDFRNRINNAALNNQTLKLPVTTEDKVSTRPSTFMPQSRGLRHQSSVLIQRPSFQHSLSHNQIYTKTPNTESASKSASTKPEADKYIVYDSDASSSDEEVKKIRQHQMLLKKHKSAGIIPREHLPRRKTSASVFYSSSSNKPKAASISTESHPLPTFNKVCHKLIHFCYCYCLAYWKLSPCHFFKLSPCVLFTQIFLFFLVHIHSWVMIF